MINCVVIILLVWFGVVFYLHSLICISGLLYFEIVITENFYILEQ